MIFRYFLFVLGFGLLLLNLVGLFDTDKVINVEEQSIFKSDSQITYRDALLFFDTVNKENKIEFAKRANTIVSKRIVHAWSDIDKDDYTKLRVTVPPQENYLLWLGSFFSEKYKKYFYHDPYMGLERGIGQCGQQSHILYMLLKKNGIDAYEIGLGGHVVVGADINGQSIVLDPDYNIFIPYGIEHLVKDTATVARYYAGIDSVYSNDYRTLGISLEKMKKLYGKGKYNTTNEKTVTIGEKYIFTEKAAYILKWLLPIGLMIPGFIFFKYCRK